MFTKTHHTVSIKTDVSSVCPLWPPALFWGKWNPWLKTGPVLKPTFMWQPNQSDYSIVVVVFQRSVIVLKHFLKTVSLSYLIVSFGLCFVDFFKKKNIYIVFLCKLWLIFQSAATVYVVSVFFYSAFQTQSVSRPTAHVPVVNRVSLRQPGLPL